MKRFYQITLMAVAMVMMASAAYAVPARPNMWRKIKLNDGTECFAFLKGDENYSYLSDREGNGYRNLGDGTYERMPVAELVELENGPQSLRAKVRAFVQQQLEAEAAKSGRKAPRKASGIPTDLSKFQGKKHGLVILAQFSDVSFDSTIPGQFGCSSTQAFYDKIINERHLDMAPFYGSVKDYFIDQSDGQFELDFDVVGPVTLANTREYYGAATYSKSGTKYTEVANDAHAGYMVYQAIQKAKDTKKADGTSVNFSDYDWDGDGEAEVVYVIYAGQGQADGGDEWCIWPHKFALSSAASNESYYKSNYYSSWSGWSLYYKTSSGTYTTWENVSMGSLTYNNTKIDTYACSNELATNVTGSTVNGTQTCGIGTICHEFSHTMGYPDMYDTSYSYDNCAQGSWDLMNSGSYNGSWNGGHDDWSKIDAGYQPCAYTSFERWCAGWMTPIVLNSATQITNLKPLSGVEGDPSDHGDAYVVYMPNATNSIKGEYYLLENRQWTNWDSSLPWFGLLINYVHYNETYWSNNKLNTISTAGHARMTHFQAGGYDYGVQFLEMDTYPYNVEFLPRMFSTSASYYSTDGSTLAANINSYFSNYNGTDYTQYFKMNTADNTQLTNTQATGTENTVAAYYYGTGSTKQTLSNQEIWDISSNNAGINNGWFNIYGGSQTVNFNYKYPSTSNTLALNQSVTSAQSIPTGFYTKITTDRSIFGDERVNTLWLPFDLNYDDCLGYFGTGVKIYSFAGYTKADGFLFDDTTYEGIHAYTPVVVVLGEGSSDISQLGGTEGFTYVQVNTTNANAEPVVESPSGWKFVGTKAYTTLPEGTFYVSNSQFFKAQGNAKLKAYRAYFQAPEVGEEVKMEDLKITMKARKTDDPKVIAAKQKEAERIEWLNNRLNPENPESPLFNPNRINETGVYSVEYAEAQQKAMNDNVYTIGGQLVGKRGQLGNMPRGIYVVNGKKVVIK